MSVIDGARMRQLIKEKYRTQSAFAKACGVSRQYVHQVITGEVDPSVERLILFANLLGVPMDELVGKESALAGALAA